MTSRKNEFKFRVLSAVLCLVLTVTQITDIGYGITKEDAENNIVEKTTDTTTYDLGDGKSQTIYHGSDVRFEDEDGVLVDYDPALVEIRNEETMQSQPLAGYAYENKEGDKKQYLPESLSEETPIIMESEDHHIHMTPSEESLLENGGQDMQAELKEEARPSIDPEEKEKKIKAAAEYDAENSGVAITYSSLENGIKESLILKERAENNVFTYVLDTGDLVPLEEDNAGEPGKTEGISFIDPETEEKVFEISPAWMDDKTENAYSEDIRYDIEPLDEGKWLLKMTVSREYLDSPERVYPVTIDPTITWTGKTNVKDAYVISGSTYQNRNFYSDSVKKMPAGRNSLGNMHRTFIAFAGIKSKLSGKSIASAYLDVYEFGDGAANQKISAYRVTGAWNPATITWKNMPAHSDYLSTITTKKTKHAKERFNLTTYVKNVVKGSWADHGIMINNVTTGALFADFCGSRYDTAAYRPRLIVTYYDKPAKPTVSIDTKSRTGNGVTIKYSGISTNGLKEVRYKFQKKSGDQWVNDSRPEASAGKYGNKSIPINGLFNGYYRVLVWGVNQAGEAGPKGNSGQLIVDTNQPSIGSVYIKTKDHEKLQDSWTKDSDPAIYVSDVKDNMGLISPYVKYAITKEEECGINKAAPSNLFKAPGKVSLSSSMPYSGYIKLTEADKKLPPGRYVIHVRCEDRGGGTYEKRVLYCKDDKAPAGDLSVSQNGKAVTELTGAVNVTLSGLGGTGSALKETRLYLCRMEDGEKKSETDLTGPITKGTVKILDTGKYENGTYRVMCTLKDEAGNQRILSKDVIIKNALEAPEISIIYQKKPLCVVKGFGENTAKVEKLQYMIDDGDWQDAEDAHMITIPQGEDGKHIIKVRGVDKSGIATKNAEAEYYCDEIAPDIKITSFARGKVTGKVTDENLKGWSLSYREKGKEDYIKAAEGKEEIEEGEIAKIDMDDPYFNEGSTYDLKLRAEDKAGNISEDEVEIVKESGEICVRVKKAGLHISRPSYEEYDKAGFTVPLSQKSFTLLGGVSSDTPDDTKWYIDNRYAGKGNELSAELSGYLDGKSHNIAAVSNEHEEMIYSRDVIENDICEKISFSGGSEDGAAEEIIAAEKEVQIQKNAVSFTIDAPAADDEGNPYIYSVKNEDGEYISITPGDRIYVSTIDENSLSKRDFTLRMEAEGMNTYPGAFIYFDTIEEENFTVSELADHLPENVSVNDKLNDRTYVYWDDLIDEKDTALSYNIYHSSKKDFEISEENLAAENITSGYYSEMNAGYSCNYYYRITVVRRDEEGNVIEESVPTRIRSGRLLDNNERAKRLGIQDYWEYTETAAGLGKANIEESGGNLVYSEDDISFESNGLETGLSRTYNSMSSQTGAFGFGWTHSYDLRLLNMYDEDEKDFTSLVFSDGTGAITCFEKKGEGYISSEGEYLSLKEENAEKEVRIKGRGKNEKKEIKSAYTMKSAEGITYLFNGGGQLIYLEEKSGDFMIFEYDEKTGFLSGTKTSKGHEITFEYTGDEQDTQGLNALLVKKVKMPDGSVRIYDYEEREDGAINLLSSVKEVGKDGKERTVSYRYNKAEEDFDLITINDAMSNPYTITYTEDDRVKGFMDPEGSGLSFEYDIKTDALTKTSITSYDVGGLLSPRRELARVSGTYDFETGYCMSQTNSKGKTTTYDYMDGVRCRESFTVVERSLAEDGTIIKSDEITRTELTQYGKKRQEQREISADGSTEEIAYYEEEGIEPDCEDLIKEETEKDGDGNIIEKYSYRYDDEGNETYCYDAVLNETTISEYNEKGDIISEKEYSGEGQTGDIISSTTYSYVYKDDGSVEERSEEIADGVSSFSVIKYDPFGREVYEETGTEDTSEFKKTTVYDGFGNVKETVTDEQGVITTETSVYDLNGNITGTETVTEEGGELKERVSETFTYDKLGRVISQEYDDNGEKLRYTTEYSFKDAIVRDPLGCSEKTISNAQTVEVKEEGELTSCSYTDHEGNVVKQFEDGIWTDTCYDDYGQNTGSFISGEEDGSGDSVSWIILTDRNGNQTHQIVNPQDGGGFSYAGEGSIVTKAGYDAQGRVTSQTDGEGNERKYTYSPKGDLSSATLSGGEKTTYQIDEEKEGSSYVATAITIDARGNKSLAKTDESGKLLLTKDMGGEGDGSIYTKYIYDRKGNLSRTTDAEGNVISYTYDKKSRVKKKEVKDSSGDAVSEVTYSYDFNDAVTSENCYEIKDGAKRAVRMRRYRYDKQGRITRFSEIHEPDPEWTDEKLSEEFEKSQISYSYDRFGDVKSIDYAFKEGVVKGLSFSYDRYRRLKEISAKKTIGSDKVRTYEYDGLGRVSLIKDYYSFGKALSGHYMDRSYDYDEIGRLSSMTYTDSADDEVKESYRFEYDKNGKVTKKTTATAYMQGDEGALTEIVKDYTYDANGRLTKAVMESDGEIKENTYSYDAVGNRTGSVIDGIETEYVYNGLDQLMKETEKAEGIIQSEASYTYDKNGNRIREREEEYTYSEDGELLSGSEGTSVKEVSMSYTPENMMGRYVRKHNGKTVITQSNRYDGNGQRIEKKEVSLDENPLTGEETEKESKTSYYYQGDSVLYTKSDSGISSMNLLTASGNIISTARDVNTDAEKWYFFNKDDQGSTKSIVDGEGRKAVSYEYDEYGNITEVSGEGIENEVCYTGQIFDEATGLYYYNARYYDPEAGSFTTQDSYRGDGSEPTTLNYYAYCGGDPVNYTDPTGHSFLKKMRKRARKAARKMKRRIRKHVRKYKRKISRKVKKAAARRFPNTYRKARRVYRGAKRMSSRMKTKEGRKELRTAAKKKAKRLLRKASTKAGEVGRKAGKKATRIVASSPAKAFYKRTSRRIAIANYAKIAIDASNDIDEGKSSSQVVSEAYVDAMFATASIGFGAVAAAATLALVSTPIGWSAIIGTGISIGASFLFDYAINKRLGKDKKSLKKRTCDFLMR